MLIDGVAKELGFRFTPMRCEFDVEQDAPEILTAVEQRSPQMRHLMTALRERVPLTQDCAAIVRPPMYRLPTHHRSVCLAIESLISRDVFSSAVVTFKGTEPLLDDFTEFLHWLMTTAFRGHDMPMGLHLPMGLRVPPGATPMDECRLESQTGVSVHRKHLTTYGQLAHAPVPLLIHAFTEQENDRYLSQLRAQLPAAAVHRVERRIKGGLGVLISYYEAAPILWMNAGAYHVPLETRFSFGLAPIVWFDTTAREPVVVRQRETCAEWRRHSFAEVSTGRDSTSGERRCSER
jgi:hypothetical protein